MFLRAEKYPSLIKLHFNDQLRRKKGLGGLWGHSSLCVPPTVPTTLMRNVTVEEVFPLWGRM